MITTMECQGQASLQFPFFSISFPALSLFFLKSKIKNNDKKEAKMKND
jgi:hypothetical protein